MQTSEFYLPEASELPNIGLYMDQLLELLEGYLSQYKRRVNEPVFTKTMINNYVKANVITMPVKKRYGKESLIELMMVFFLKQLFSIADTATFIKYTIDLHHGDSVEAYNHFRTIIATLSMKKTADHRELDSSYDTLLVATLDAVLNKINIERQIDQWA